MLVRAFVYLALPVTMAAFAPCQQISGSFRCDSHTVAIDRFPAAKSVPASPPTERESEKILETEFSAFDPTYSLESVRLALFFVQDRANPYRKVGKIRIMALLRTQGGQQWRELIDEETGHLVSPGWYDNGWLSLLLRSDLEQPQADDEVSASDDPMVEHSGRPQVRIQQAEAKIPLFLLKFIGLTSAGGRGDVDTEQAIVLDLRGGEFVAPAAVGCVKNDFAGEGHEDEWINCQWNAHRQDYVCRTNAYYNHDWAFLLIEGKKLPVKSRTRSRNAGDDPSKK